MTVVPGPPYPGVYEHYKGDYYVVHKIITDSTNTRAGKIMVLYESLETKEFHVRDVAEFLSFVHGDGTGSWTHHFHVEIKTCKECRPRFRPVDTTNLETTYVIKPKQGSSG